MKTAKPLYISYRESFSKDFYQPQAPVVAAPVVCTEMDSPELLALLTSECPPQNSIFYVDSLLNVTNRAGNCTLDSLYNVLQLCTRTVPVLYLRSQDTVAPLTDFLDVNRAADVILCARYEQRSLLKAAYREMPMLRGMLDCRHTDLPENTAALPGILTSHGAENVILDASACTRKTVHVLQQRFIHVISPDTNGIAEAAAKGVNGILTDNPAACYRLFASFPENSFLRMHNLIAHKGFQNNGMYSENTISGVKAAGSYGFDGAEIDIKLTSDLVPIVMHNLNTKGLFDCPEKIIEQVPYDELKSLRRIGFPEEGVDLFADLMQEMHSYPDTPVLIEFKPRDVYHRVEEMIAQAAEILADPASQQNCTGIMGSSLEPGLGYVHAHLPTLPLAYCDYSPKPMPPQNREQAEEMLCHIAMVSSGLASGYNPEDVMIGRTFNEYAKMRGWTVFPWSRSWTLAPSTWEKNGVACDATYLAGFDAWTTDHGDMYLDYPILLDAKRYTGVPQKANLPFRPVGINTFRNGTEKETETDLFVLEGELIRHPDGSFSAPRPGHVKAMLMQKLDLHFGDHYYIFSEPVEWDFE